MNGHEPRVIDCFDCFIVVKTIFVSVFVIISIITMTCDDKVEEAMFTVAFTITMAAFSTRWTFHFRHERRMCWYLTQLRCLRYTIRWQEWANPSTPSRPQSVSDLHWHAQRQKAGNDHTPSRWAFQQKSNWHNLAWGVYDEADVFYVIVAVAFVFALLFVTNFRALAVCLVMSDFIGERVLVAVAFAHSFSV